MALQRKSTQLIAITLRFVALAGCLWLVGCSTLGTVAGPADKELQRLLAGEALMSSSQVSWALPREPLISVNDNMREFIRVYVPVRANQTAKLRALVYAATHPGLLGFRYDPQATYTAAEAYQQQRGNCLAFSALFIALAREVGLKASFNEVEVPPDWDLLGENTFVRYRHVNVLVQLPSGRQIVDLRLMDYDTEFPQRRIGDRLAQAQYYNNRGMTLLGQGRYREAFPYMRRALELAPETDYLWNNLGSLYRRAGSLAEAELAYRQALRLNPHQQLALSNLSRLYLQTGDRERAAVYAEEVKRFRLANPYYRFYRAQTAVDAGDFDEAREHIQQAIRSEPKEPRFHSLAADIYRALGLTDKAWESRERAARLGAETAFAPVRRPDALASAP